MPLGNFDRFEPVAINMRLDYKAASHQGQSPKPTAARFLQRLLANSLEGRGGVQARPCLLGHCDEQLDLKRGCEIL